MYKTHSNSCHSDNNFSYPKNLNKELRHHSQPSQECNDQQPLQNCYDLGLQKSGQVIGHINIQGLRTKIDELKILLTTNKIDIFGVTETKLNEKHLTQSFAIDGYQTPLRKDRINNSGGGLLIYIRNNLNCIQRTDLEDNNLEHIWVEIKNTNSKPLLLCLLYRPPNSLAYWNTQFERNIENAQLEDKEIILLGDFNKDLMTERSTRDWLNFTLSLGLTQLIESPTRVCTTSKTLIDHIYSDNPQNIIWTVVPQIGLSDHYPIFCSRKVNHKHKKTSHLTIKYRSFKNFNEQDFFEDLNNVDFSNVMSILDVNDALTQFMKLFSSVINKHVPLRQHRVKRQQQPNWLNSEILDAMKERDKCKIRNDWNSYKFYRNKVSCLIHYSKRASYEQKITEGQNDPSSIWKIFKEFKSPNQGKDPITSLNIDGCDIVEPEIISNEFNSFFTNIAAKLKEDIPLSDFDSVKQFVRSRVPEPMFFNIPLIDKENVKKMLLNLDHTKSTGLDDIGARFLKMSASYIYPIIHHVLNLSISQNTFPNVWKLAKVNPLFKAGSRFDVNNYRPISILPILSKLLERHTHDSFMSYLNHYNLLTNTQSGFRKGHSCETALVNIVDKWLKALNDGYVVGAVMVDFKKAFDLVDHNILLQKLRVYKCSEKTIQWFKSYMIDRKQCVSLNGVLSSKQNITCGVPQGSILGPLLFLIFINDLPLSISADINRTDMYADDTTIHSINKSVEIVQKNLQACLSNLEKWCKFNGMLLNTDKTKVLLIATPHKKARLQNPSLFLTFKEIPLKTSKCEKLLGVYIDDNLKWDEHINKLRRKLASNIWLLSKIKWYVPFKARVLFYNAYIQPHLDFCNIVWGGSCKTHLQKLFILQKRACKLIFGQNYVSIEDSLEKINALDIADKIILQKAKFMYKVSKGQVPNYIDTMFVRDLKTFSNLRSCSIYNFSVPRPKMELFKQSISFSGPRIWNQIPSSIQSIDTIEKFTSHFIRWKKSSRLTY